MTHVPTSKPRISPSHCTKLINNYKVTVDLNYWESVLTEFGRDPGFGQG